MSSREGDSKLRDHRRTNPRKLNFQHLHLPLLLFNKMFVTHKSENVDCKVREAKMNIFADVMLLLGHKSVLFRSTCLSNIP